MFNGAFEHNLQGFMCFIQCHAPTLQALTLSFTSIAGSSSEIANTCLSYCLDHILVKNKLFWELRQFTVYLPLLQAGKATVTRYMQVSGQLLTHLAVWNSYYTYAQVDELVSALSHGSAKLKGLNINVLVLNGPLLDLLSTKTTFIVELTIVSWLFGVGDQDDPVSVAPLCLPLLLVLKYCTQEHFEGELS